MFKWKECLILCYNCKKPGNIAKNYYEVGPTCLCCKLVGHKVEDFPRIIAKLERKDIRQEIVKDS